MPRGTILNFTNILPGVPGSHPHVTIDAQDARIGDMLALYPLPVIETVVTGEWASGHITTGYGRTECARDAQVTITSIAS